MNRVVEDLWYTMQHPLGPSRESGSYENHQESVEKLVRQMNGRQVREQRRIDNAPTESAESFKDYVDHVADIAIRADKAGGVPDFHTPLVDNNLPSDLTPESAARMASDLSAALPRLRELLRLLTRRGNSEEND